MKKIVMILIAVVILIIAVIVAFQFIGEKKEQENIESILNKINNAPYTSLAENCTYEDPQMQTCCIGSVYDMQQMNGLPSTSELCNGASVNTIECPGAYEWCIPPNEVTMPTGAEMDNDNDHKACETDTDCVPATCCHATDVINKNFAPDCSDMMCTMSCETALDCGRGKPVCKDGICEIGAK